MVEEIAEREAPGAKVRARISGEAFLTPPGPLYDVVVEAIERRNRPQARAVDQRRDVRRPLPDPALPGRRFRPAQCDDAQGRRMRGGRGHPGAVADLRAHRPRKCSGSARRPTSRAPLAFADPGEEFLFRTSAGAKMKPWTVSQPIARRMSAWATVSTASATISQPTPLISWITAWTITRAFSLVSMSAISDGIELDPVERHRCAAARGSNSRCRNRRSRSRAPSSRSAAISSSTPSLTSIAALSVNSSSTSESGTSASANAWRSFAKKSGRSTCRGLMLKPRRPSKPLRCQCAERSPRLRRSPSRRSRR